MSTTPNQPPPQPKTTELPKADRIEILIQEMRVEVRGEFRALRADLEVVDNQVRVLSDRMALAERRMDEAERRVETQSTRVRGTSEENLKQDATIGLLVAKVSEIEGNQARAAEERALTAQQVAETKAMTAEIQARVTGFFTNPKVVFVGKVVWGAAMAYAAARGLRVLP